MHIYRVPKVFAEDHWQRELVFEGDWIVHETKQHYYVRLSDEGASDLESDAEYYSEPDMEWAEGLEGIRASARFTLKAMRKQMQEIEDTGSTPWDGKFEVTPVYCMDCGVDITCMTRYAAGRCYPCHHEYWSAKFRAERAAKQDLGASMM